MLEKSLQEKQVNFLFDERYTYFHVKWFLGPILWQILNFSKEYLVK